MTARDVKSRRPARNRNGGQSAKSATNTKVSITTGSYSVSGLPPDIAARITVDPVSGCWIAGPPHDRYGYARHAGEGLHRVVYRLLVGEIPAGRVLDHVQARGCTSVACCNPAHLEPVTHRANVLRGRSFAAVNFAKDECIHGHKFDLYNTYWRPGGRHRDCRACIRARVRKYQARQRRRSLRLAA